MTRLDFLMGPTVDLAGDMQAVPVNRCRYIKVVDHIEWQVLSLLHTQLLTEIGAVYAERVTGRAIAEIKGALG